MTCLPGLVAISSLLLSGPYTATAAADARRTDVTVRVHDNGVLSEATRLAARPGGDHAAPAQRRRG